MAGCKHLHVLGISLGIAIFILFLEISGSFNVLDRAWFDFLTRAQVNSKPYSQEAALVLIDDESLRVMGEHYHQRWPWSRDAFAALLAAIHQAGAKAIVVDLLFLEPSEDVYLDELLGSYAAACENVFLASKENKPPIVWRELAARNPALASRIGHVSYQPDSDGVVRHYLVHKSLAAAVESFDYQLPESIRIRWQGSLADMPAHLKFSAAPLLLEGYGPKGIISRVKQAVKDELDPEQIRDALKKLPPNTFGDALKNKIVFLGANATAIADIKAMPVGRHEPGVLAHYTAWLNLHQKNFILPMPQFLRMNITLWLVWFFALIYILIAWNHSFRVAIFGGAMLSVAWLFTSQRLFAHGWSMPIATALVIFAISAVAIIVRHWLKEYRARHQVQRIFGSYVSPQVLELIQRDPRSLKLGGQKCEATIFFSDLAGFTDLSEKMQPEKLVQLVNDYLTEMSDFIIDHGGYLDKYIGDAIMGVFGAPVALPNHALAACRAAIETQLQMRALNQRLAAESEQKLKVRIGIHTGPVIVGNMGSPRKLNYTAIGDVVNLSSRLEGANKEFGTLILITEATLQMAGDEMITRPVELLRVKGKQLPVQTYELIGMKKDSEIKSIYEFHPEFLSKYTDAYALYKKKDFKAALEKFSEAHKLNPDDLLCAIYEKRCQNFILTPPPPDWDGVHILHTK